MTRQESLQSELHKLLEKDWDFSVIDKLEEGEILLFSGLQNKKLTETQLDIAELLILRYYECGGE